MQGEFNKQGQLDGRVCIVDSNGAWFNISYHMADKWHGEYFSTEYTGERNEDDLKAWIEKETYEPPPQPTREPPKVAR